ncbi:MFS superfamily sulfate permease-like transporter [Massilia sp. MP_M2]
MAGCAMIGQSVTNVQSGGRTHLSTLTAGVVLLFMVVFLGDWVRQIPMAALVAVMIMVAIGTFSWGSITNLRAHPASSSIVMLATVIVTVATHDLAKGMLAGVLLSGVFFAQKVSRMLGVTARVDADSDVRRYLVSGHVFFASADQLVHAFDYNATDATVHIDLSDAHFWDITAIGALDKVVLKLRRAGAQVFVHGLNEASATLMKRFAIHDKDGAQDMLAGH